MRTWTSGGSSLTAALVAAALGVGGCGAKETATTTDDAASSDDVAAGADAADAGADAVTGPDYGNPDCDPLMPTGCTLPWPSNLYLKPDPARQTGYTLTFGATSLPRNAGGVQLSPDPYKRLDGYGVGSHVLMIWPNLDTSTLPTEADPMAGVQADANIVWLEVGKDGKTLTPIPYWSELDLQPVNDTANTVNADLTKRVLFTRSAVPLHEGTRYIVAVRNLKDTAGKTYTPSPAFAALVAGTTAGSTLAPRQARFDEIFQLLDGHGIKKDSLQLAWDFVTASHDTLHGRMIEMRDKALAAVGDKGPEITVTEVKTYTLAENPDLAAEITGTFKAPDFMETFQGPNGYELFRFHTDADGKLVQNGWRDAKFWLRIPQSALQGEPQELVEYGHGLNGDGGEIHQGWEAPHGNKRHLIYFAANMIGMSEDDTGGIVMMLQDFNYWHSLPERVTAGVVEYTLLQLGMRERIADLAYVKQAGVKFAKDANGKIPVYYSGNSQGGIYGQTVLAVSPFVQRAQLGEAGANYSTLLHRSVDFNDPFFPILKGVWPDVTDQAVLLSMIQLLWDTVDPISYVRHISVDPLPGTQPHAALIVTHPGDFQVAPVTEEVVARGDTGVHVMQNYGRPVAGVTETAYPFTGSGLVSVDFGNGWAAPGNWPPGPKWGPACTTAADCPADPAYGQVPYNRCGKKSEDDAKTYCFVDDPHDRGHGLDAINDQMVWFFHTGEIKDFCGGNGCKPE